MVQLSEECDANSAARREGFSNICEIGEERICHAGETIKSEIDKDNKQLEIGAEPKPVPDIGFRVLRVDDSCLQDEYAAPNQYDQAQLDLFVDNAAEGAVRLTCSFRFSLHSALSIPQRFSSASLAGKHASTLTTASLSLASTRTSIPRHWRPSPKSAHSMPSSATHASPTMLPWQTSRSSSKPSVPTPSVR